jgi:ribosomal protein S18 acetylase RimI-like enzyme
MLGPEHVGRRVAVRIRLADPEPGRRFTDVTGELIELGPVRWRVLRASGEVVTIDAAAVVAARPIPPKPTPFSEILALERLLALTWPAIETAPLGGWTLRYSQGFSRRANSVLALTAPEPRRSLRGDDSPSGTDAAIAAVADWYGARGARPLVSLAGAVTKRLDDELAARGWAAEGETAVMTRPIEASADTGEVRITDAPGPEFLEQIGRGVPEVAARVFGSGADRGYAEVWRDGALAARGRGAIAGDTVAITAIGRQGLGTAVLHALEAWGAANGAARAALQVETDNAAAIAMYASLGYAERYRYWYRGPVA